VDDLASRGVFRTIDIARHPEVQAAHPELRKDPQFNQHIGMYLTGATGRLRITQVSRKGQSNAKWTRTAEDSRSNGATD
jgi:hypothetical protein